MIFIPLFLSPRKSLETFILEAASYQPSTTPNVIFLSLSGQLPRVASALPHHRHPIQEFTAPAGLAVENEFSLQEKATHDFFFFPELGFYHRSYSFCPSLLPEQPW